MELYSEKLTATKEQYGRSNGFFVYVRGRLVNLDDPLFGLRALSHGTWSKFRMIIHIDRLDEELRSTRETVRDGPLTILARKFLQGAFNVARNWEVEKNNARAGGGATDRIQATPGSLTRKPIVSAVSAALETKARLRSIAVPSLEGEEKEAFLEEVRSNAEGEGGLVASVELVDIAQRDPVAVLDVSERKLQINGLHPFVASFRNEFSQGLEVLSLVAMSEVLAEAHLYELGIPKSQISDILTKRDDVLRAFARYFKRTAHAIAEDLTDAAHDQDGLEVSLAEAFESMGFEAVRIGGNGKPDGRAEAALSGTSDGPRRYSVSLEAKSKERSGAKVKADQVKVSTIARHRKMYECDHAVVVGPQFSAQRGGALLTEIEADRTNTGKTITLVRIKDLARLVRTVSLRAIGLDEIRPLFRECSSPAESEKWIDQLSKKKAPSRLDYKAVLRVIWKIQGELPNENVDFSNVQTALRYEEKIEMTKAEVADLCRAIARFTDQIRVLDQSVELRQRPDIVVAAIRREWSSYPEEERKTNVWQFKL